jgi:site-specific recombinase
MDSILIVAIVGIVALVVVFALALNRSFSLKGSREEFELKAGKSETLDADKEL